MEAITSGSACIYSFGSSFNDFMCICEYLEHSHLFNNSLLVSWLIHVKVSNVTVPVQIHVKIVIMFDFYNQRTSITHIYLRILSNPAQVFQSQWHSFLFFQFRGLGHVGHHEVELKMFMGEGSSCTGRIYAAKN